MMAPKKMTPAGGALWRSATWMPISRMANDPTTLTMPVDALATGVRLRQNRRAVSTAGFCVSTATALGTGEVRGEVGSVVAPLTELVALAAVGGHIDTGLAVYRRR